MAVWSCLRRAPLRPDSISLSRRQPRTLEAYRRAVGKFVGWCEKWNVQPTNLDELDDLLIEWRGQSPQLSRAQFAHAVAGVEIAVPFAKRQLPWCKALQWVWDVVAVINHHLPMPKSLALLLALGMSSSGSAGWARAWCSNNASA